MSHPPIAKNANQKLIAVLLAVVFSAACSVVDTGQQTLVAENAMLNTQMVDIRGTATIVADQMARTAEHIETAVRRAEARRDELSATLQATGVDPTSIAQVSPNPDFLNTPTPFPQSAFSVDPSLITPNPAAAANLTVLPPTPGQPSLFGMVMAQNVGDNDCALAAVTLFPTTSERIYVVATAANIAAGTTLAAQWYQNNVLVASQDFAPEEPINNNCIWFYIDQTDFVFTAGSYGVQLSINGTPAGPRMLFTIAG